MRTLIAGLSLSLTLSVLVTTAVADPKKDKARGKALYDEGLRHYNVAEYTEAIASWKESYLLTKAPLLLFNLGQAYRLSGDCAKALTFYDNYEREDSDPKNKEELDQAVALCKTAPAKVDKPVPDKLTIPVPDKPADKPVTTPDKQPDHRPVPDHEAGKQPPPGKRPDPPSASGQVEDAGHGKRLAGVIVGGGGVVLGGIGIYFAAAAHSQSSSLDGFRGEWGPKQANMERQGQRDSKLALTFTGLGVAAVGVGVVLYVLGRHPSEETAGLSVVPTAGGAELAWGTAF